jgi:hypothetical protein
MVAAAAPFTHSGMTYGIFRPDATITCAEMAAMITKALKLSIDENVAIGSADDIWVLTRASVAGFFGSLADAVQLLVHLPKFLVVGGDVGHVGRLGVDVVHGTVDGENRVGEGAGNQLDLV